MELSKKVKALRKKQGLSQLELAEKYLCPGKQFLDGKREHQGHQQKIYNV